MFITSFEPSRAASIPEFTLGVVGGVFESTGSFKMYKYVQYQNGSGNVAAVTGNAAYYYTKDGHKNNQVTSDLSDSREVGAGVLQSAPGNGEYCWVQIKGPATLTTPPTAGTDGDPLTPTGATDGTLDVVSLIGSHNCAYAGDISEREIICDFPY